MARVAGEDSCEGVRLILESKERTGGDSRASPPRNRGPAEEVWDSQRVGAKPCLAFIRFRRLRLVVLQGDTLESESQEHQEALKRAQEQKAGLQGGGLCL